MPRPRVRSRGGRFASRWAPASARLERLRQARAWPPRPEQEQRHDQVPGDGSFPLRVRQLGSRASQPGTRQTQATTAMQLAPPMDPEHREPRSASSESSRPSAGAVEVSVVGLVIGRSFY